MKVDAGFVNQAGTFVESKIIEVDAVGWNRSFPVTSRRFAERKVGNLTCLHLTVKKIKDTRATRPRPKLRGKKKWVP